MKEEKIKVLALLPMELPKEIELDNTLEAMQNFVGGLIECITSREAKQIIRTHCKTFGGTLDDAECMKLTGLARNTHYKYKRQIRAELMAEQDLPKGASIFYEPPKSF